MKKSLICTLAFLAAAPAAAHAATSTEPDNTVRVEYSDLDLSQPAGAAKMLRRLDDAATEACGAWQVSAVEYRWAVQRSACHAASLSSAVTALGAPRVTELYDQRIAKTGARVSFAAN